MTVSSNQVPDVEKLMDAGVSEAALAKKLYELGLDYATGHGVERNLVEAHKWLNLASVHGSEAAAVDRDDVARELSRRDIRRALKMAREWNATH